MHIDWWTLGLQTVNVLVLIWLLRRFLFSPVAAIIEARQKAATEMLDEAAAAKSAADGIRADIAREATDIAAARDQKLAAAASEADELKARLVSDAHAEVEKLRLQASADMARLQEEKMKDLGRRANALAIEVTEKLLDRLPDAARIDGFLDGLVQAIAALPADSRSALADDGNSLTVRSARALTADEQERCRALITETINHPVTTAFEVDHALIAGFEIQSPYIHIRNSFRADLERISSELEDSGSGE